MDNFFIRLKVCAFLPMLVAVKKPVVGWHWWLWKELVGMCGKWNVRQATLSKCSKWPPSAWIHASSLFRHWSTASSTKLCWIQPVSQDASATRPYRGLVLDTRKKWKRMKNWCILHKQNSKTLYLVATVCSQRWNSIRFMVYAFLASWKKQFQFL